MKYIDAHCHLNFKDYDVDREEVINRASVAGVGMIIVGTDRETSARAIEIATEHDNIWAIIGLHPIYAREEAMARKDQGELAVFDFNYYHRLAQHPKVVGIGECGYDYFRTTADIEGHSKFQHDAFIGQIEIANSVKKPLMLHIRNGVGQGRNAYVDALEVLKEKARVTGDAHFFAGSWGEAKQFLDLGFNISFTGVITFARTHDEVIRNVPLDRIMSETDCPYVTPEPHRGERNEPLFVTEVAQTIAAIRGESLEVVFPRLVENATRLFSL